MKQYEDIVQQKLSWTNRVMAWLLQDKWIGGNILAQCQRASRSIKFHGITESIVSYFLQNFGTKKNLKRLFSVSLASRILSNSSYGNSMRMIQWIGRVHKKIKNQPRIYIPQSLQVKKNNN